MINNNLIAVNWDENSTIYFEISPVNVKKNNSVFSNTSSEHSDKVIEKSKEFLENKFETIKSFANSLASSFNNLSNTIDEVELEFSVKFGTESGIIISTLNAESTTKIKLRWSKKSNE